MFKILCLTFILLPALFIALPARAEDSIPPIQRLGTGIPTSIAASPDGKTLAVGSSIGVWLLDANTLQPFTLWETGFWVNKVEYSNDGRYLQINAMVYDGSNGQPVNVDAGQVKWIDDQCSPNGLLCAKYRPVTIDFYDSESHLIVVDTDTTVEVALIRQWNTQDIAWSPDNQTLYLFSKGTNRERFTVKSWDTHSWKQKQVLKGFFAGTGICAWYGIGSYPCKSSPMRAWWHDVHIYDPTTNTLLSRFEAHHISLSAAKLSLDEALLATSGTDAGRACGGDTPYFWACDVFESSTRMWDFTSQALLVELPVVFVDITFSPDNRIIIGQTSDGYQAWDWQSAQRLWMADDNASGACIGGFYTDKSTVKCIAVSPDGKYIAAGTHKDGGNVVRIRRLDTGEVVANLGGHTSSISSVLFNPDGTKIAASSLDGTILIWPVP